MKLLVYQIDNMTQKVMVNKNEMLSCPEMNMYTYGNERWFTHQKRKNRLVNKWYLDN